MMVSEKSLSRVRSAAPAPVVGLHWETAAPQQMGVPSVLWIGEGSVRQFKASSRFDVLPGMRPRLPHAPPGHTLDLF